MLEPKLAEGDPMNSAVQRLTASLTSEPVRSENPTGLLAVEALADGTLNITHIDDRLASGRGHELAAALNEVIRDTLSKRRDRTGAALQNFRQDPRIAAAIASIADAVDAPPPKPEPQRIPRTPTIDDEWDGSSQSNWVGSFFEDRRR